MSNDVFALLRFHEAHSERIWGGTRLRSVLGKETPPDKVIGEAWLISDHAEHESVVASGPHEGRTLRQLLEEDAAAILGTRAQLTIHGRFPLLLKLLDSGQALSVQVHPDDNDARRLGEPDVGKTEMWHVFEAAPGSQLICGLDQGLGPEAFATSITGGSLEDALTRFEVQEGASVFVPVGTVHAIGGGILLAEIQQNSDLTYRIYDWGRVDADGKPRELHIGKALEATHFGSPHGGLTQPLGYDIENGRCEVLGACRHFAAELLCIQGEFSRPIAGESFHILLAKHGSFDAQAGGERYKLKPGEAVLVPGCAASYQITGTGALLDYYVPDLQREIIAPLLAAGHAPPAILALGGPPKTSDLAPLL